MMMTKPHKLIVHMVFGSHLYGLNTAASDVDLKGVFLPSHEDLLCGTAPRVLSSTTKTDKTAKNGAHDTDDDLYSLQYFFQLACQGETVALDMLHAPPEKWLVRSPVWEKLHAARHRFYTKNLKAFVGYARKQAAKYGVKGSRLAEAEQVLAVLEGVDGKVRFQEILDRLPQGEHCRTVVPSDGSIAHYLVCGKQFQVTAKVREHLPGVRKFIDDFGARARMAKDNQGVDWKAVSHALRAAFQTKAVLTQGDFTFPLPEREFLLAVKGGTLPYQEVGACLDRLIDEVEDLAAKSDLPGEVSSDWARTFLVELVEEGLS